MAVKEKPAIGPAIHYASVRIEDNVAVAVNRWGDYDGAIIRFGGVRDFTLSIMDNEVVSRLHAALSAHLALASPPEQDISPDDPRLGVAVDRAIDEAQSNGEADEARRAAGAGDNHHELPEQIAAEEASA